MRLFWKMFTESRNQLKQEYIHFDQYKEHSICENLYKNYQENKEG